MSCSKFNSVVVKLNQRMGAIPSDLTLGLITPKQLPAKKCNSNTP